MKTPDMNGPEMAELDRQTGEVLSPWFASETVSPPPPEILAGVQARVQTTDRRAGWRIADRWLWQRSGTQRASLVLATATGVLVLALTGVTGAGVFLMADNGGPDPAFVAGQEASTEPAEVIAPTPATALVQASVEPEATVEPLVTAEPEVMPANDNVATKVTGSVTAAPVVVSEGTSTTSPQGVTDTADLVTEAMVEFDDARLSGVQRATRIQRDFGREGEGAVARGLISIENDGGTWTGRFTSATPPGRDGALRAVELIGDGDYAGLTALLHYDLARSWGDPRMISGVVAPGERPSYPDSEKWTYYKEFKEDLGPAPKLRRPRERDKVGLPAAVEGSMTETISWISDDTNLYDDSVREDEADAQFLPMWNVSDLSLNDERLQMAGYETLLNSYYYQWLDNGSTFSGLSRAQTADGGAWRGRIEGFSDPTEPVLLAGLHQVVHLTGDGAYEGLSALLFGTPDPAIEEDIYDSWSVEGMLFAGDLPPYPVTP